MYKILKFNIDIALVNVDPDIPDLALIQRYFLAGLINNYPINFN
jgi:hypothetical protein